MYVLYFIFFIYFLVNNYRFQSLDGWDTNFLSLSIM
jgi:hypothetical protein